MFKWDKYHFWTFVLSVMHTASVAQSLQKNQRVAIEEAIRKQHCPEITYDEWLEIEQKIVDSKGKIMSAFMGLLPLAIGEKMPVNKDLDILALLDTSFRDQVKFIDFDQLKKNLPNDQSENTKRTLDLINRLKELQTDYKAGK